MTYYYSAFDLLIQSDLRLPGLKPIPAPVKPFDILNLITIVYGAVSQDGLQNVVTQGATYQTNQNEFWLNINFIARFLVSNGHTIIIDPQNGIDEDTVRTFLFATCFEALLRQRGLALLPGYALKMGEFCLAFADQIGVGQSMLQCLFYKRGYSFLSDQFLAINRQACVLPGFNQLVIGSQALTAAGVNVNTLKPLRPGIEKFVIPLEHQYHSDAMPVKHVYFLKKHQHADIFFSSRQMPVSFSTKTQRRDVDQLVSLNVIDIHVPVKGLNLPQLADRIEQYIKEGHCHVQP